MSEEIESVMIKVELEDSDNETMDPNYQHELYHVPQSKTDQIELNSRRGTKKGRPRKYVPSEKRRMDKTNIYKKTQLNVESTAKKCDAHGNSDSDCNAKTTNVPKVRKFKSANHICTICPMKFTRFMDLERHVYRHTGIRNYSCNECGVKFITTNDLNKHRQSHATEAKFPCCICTDKKFRTVMSLRAHVKLCHGDKKGESKHLCTECGATFRTGSTLWMHKRRIHTDIRKFKCELCDKGFCKQMELTNHMKSHTDFREFKCDLCPAEYKRKITLLIHKTEKHSIGHHSKHQFGGRKNQACPYCLERFALREQLQFHIRRNHTGSKPFQCCLCQKNFIRKGYVKDHLKRKHHMTGDEIAMGDYVISNEMPISNLITEDASLNDVPNISSTTSLIMPQAVYKDETISDMDDDDIFTDRSRDFIV